ncbi:hypothetical protein Acsp04_27610 [Actinomadura sp. NBRC 104425]|uniref:ATP-binding protein n=1 Tax=Actinomadura sp. NBRC 104425 TaxID=3032204 RepID=UPI0024A3E8E1|nr:ATP-binding protein [Actinomadura sp. NBRC 104425]GLZ12526.1 hypothetical protein Acsp04_27610 [Actinomadura sp. NBRC 104425]
MNDHATKDRESQDREIRMTLLAEPATVGLVREIVRYTLESWHYSRPVIEDSTLVMSEIVTNAVAAAPAHQIRIGIAVHEECPLLECWDPSPVLPSPCDASEDAEAGRGLMIIRAYAKEAGGLRPRRWCTS